MDSKDKEILEYNNKFIKKVLKSALYTFLVSMVFIWGINLFISLLLSNASAENENTWIVISVGIGTIFTVFYCTFTIIEEIRKNK